MVEVATTLGKTGLQDWLIQRVSAVIIALDLIFWAYYFLTHSNISYLDWQQLFSSSLMRYSHILVLLSLLAHAWIGFWTITTDYIKPLVLRLPLQIVFILSVFLSFIWGMRILYSSSSIY